MFSRAVIRSTLDWLVLYWSVLAVMVCISGVVEEVVCAVFFSRLSKLATKALRLSICSMSF